MEDTTLREMIEAGERGGFAKRLLAFYDNITLRTLMDAYSVADSKNKEALENVFPEVEYCHRQWCNATQKEQEVLERLFQVNNSKPTQLMLEREFDGLCYLEKTGTPHQIPIR